MTEQGTPVLLTEAEHRKMMAEAGIEDARQCDNLIRLWQGMGLIAPEPEPVDARVWRIERALRGFCPNDLKHYKHTKRGGAAIFLKSLEREGLTVTVGKELGQAAARPLTRDDVREMVKNALRGKNWVVEYDDFLPGSPVGPARDADAFIDRLHTALTQRMEGRDG